MDKVWLETVMKNQQRCESISKILNVQTELAVPKGENYCSIIDRATLDILTVEGKKAKKKVIIKSIPGGAQAIFIQEHGLFKKEIEAYTTILSPMENLMIENGFKKDKAWCKLIAFKPYDYIVLEDLSEKGYATINRKKMLDLDHAIIGVKSLGCFHGVSKILLNRGVFSKEDFRPWTLLESEKTIEFAFKTAMGIMSEAVLTKWGPEFVKIGQKLTDFNQNLENILKNVIELDETRFNVVNHGDCWTNNLMFKHGPKNQPTGVKFVDYQMCHYNSFAMDLTYFMFNSIQPKIRRANRSLIIKAYYESVRECLLKYGTEEENVPTLESIMNEMDRINFFGIILLCTFFPTMSADTADTIDFDKITIENDVVQGAEEAVNKAIYVSSNYINNIKDDLKDFFN